METFETKFGPVTLEKLIHVYEISKAHDLKRTAAQLEFLKTEEGKQLNRARAKAYYEKNRDKIREKNRNRYRERTNLTSNENPEHV
jgi:hypothetical protein